MYSPLINRVLTAANQELGYQAGLDPSPGSKYGRWAATVTGKSWYAASSRKVPFCDLFVSWVFAQAGVGAAIGVAGNTVFAYTVAHRNVLRRFHNDIPIRDAQPGDIVFFRFSRRGDSVQHVGIVEKNIAPGVLQTIEGNTSNGRIGSQAHGGGVWRRVRRYGIVSVHRPAWHLVADKKNYFQNITNYQGEENMFIIKVDNRDLYLAQDGTAPYHITPAEWSGIAAAKLRVQSMTGEEFQAFQAGVNNAIHARDHSTARAVWGFKNPRVQGGKKDAYYHQRAASLGRPID